MTWASIFTVWLACHEATGPQAICRRLLSLKSSAERFCERIAEAKALCLPKCCGPKHEDGGACSKFRPRNAGPEQVCDAKRPEA